MTERTWPFPLPFDYLMIDYPASAVAPYKCETTHEESPVTSTATSRPDVTGLGRYTALGAPDRDVRVVVLSPPSEAGRLLCGDSELVAVTVPCSASAERGTGELRAGERYSDEHSGLLVVCTNGGAGPLSFNGRTLTRATASALQLA
jgi:hypothetical protein